MKMKKILFALCFLAAAAHATGGVPGAPTGAPQSAETADLVSPATTINAICASPAAGCSAGQWVTLKMGGRSTVAGTVVPANFTGSFQCWFQRGQNGVWWQGMIRMSVNDQNSTTNSWTTVSSLSASSVNQSITCMNPYGGATDVALVSTAAVTNTAVVTLVNSNTPMRLLEGALSSRGSASINGYVDVQEAKDTGRSYVAIVADGVTPAIAETVITFTKTVADTQTTGQTSYTITSGKLFRVQAICASFTAGAAANRVRVALRLNTGGACVAGSNILLPAIELAPNYGTATAAEGGANGCVTIPDGLDITGNGTKAICLSENATAASGTLTANLIGFEY
jgi:hypothetical protein